MMRLVRAVYRFTEDFPADEKSNLTGSMRKAAVGLPSQIADGFAAEDTEVLVAKLERCREGIRELQTYLALAARLRYGSRLSRAGMRRRLRGAVVELGREAELWRSASPEGEGEAAGRRGEVPGPEDEVAPSAGGSVMRLRFRHLPDAA